MKFENGTLRDDTGVLGRLWNGCCLEKMKQIPDGKVNLILTDLPYGTTSCPWDSIIPLEPLWEQYLRVTTPNAAIVLTSAQPFTTTLIASQLKLFRYCWYWVKNNKTSFAAAKYQPMRNVEDIPVFYRKAPTYNPQGTQDIPVAVGFDGEARRKLKTRDTREGVYSGEKPGGSLVGKYTSTLVGYPHQTLMFPKEVGLHPTQKPMGLFEYMIRTYTNIGDLVLDSTCGSGTTAAACIRTQRKFVCIERDPDIYNTAVKRVTNINPGFGLM